MPSLDLDDILIIDNKKNQWIHVVVDGGGAVSVRVCSYLFSQ